MFLKQINKIYSYKLLGSGACALKLSEDLKCEALNYFWQDGVFKYILVAERREANDAKSLKAPKEGAGSLNSASSMGKKDSWFGMVLWERGARNFAETPSALRAKA